MIFFYEVKRMVDLVIVKAKVRDACGEMSVSSDFADALNERVHEMIKKAVWRAKENGRRTVMGKDI
jgi:histone H3/H4